MLEDKQAVVDGQSQTDASFRSTRLYTRLSAVEVRKQLIQQKGCCDEVLPSQETIRAADHDFQPQAKLTPFGILLPQYGDVFHRFQADQQFHGGLLVRPARAFSTGRKVAFEPIRLS